MRRGTQKRSKYIAKAYLIVYCHYGRGGNYSGGADLSGSIGLSRWSDPIAGMIAGNAMVAVGLCYNNLGQQVISEQQQIQEKLESWRRRSRLQRY